MDTRFLESLTVADTGSFAEAARRLREYASQVVDLRGPHEFAAGIKGDPRPARRDRANARNKSRTVSRDFALPR